MSVTKFLVKHVTLNFPFIASFVIHSICRHGTYVARAVACISCSAARLLLLTMILLRLSKGDVQMAVTYFNEGILSVGTTHSHV